jgi:hypothetical protein
MLSKTPIADTVDRVDEASGWNAGKSIQGRPYHRNIRSNIRHFIFESSKTVEYFLIEFETGE